MAQSSDSSGLILVSHGNRGVVETESGDFDVHFRRSVGRPICGDRVRLAEAGGEHLVVTEILPRSNEFARADGRRCKQVIAANLDQAVIVIAPAPPPSTDLVERYLVAVHSLGIEPILAVNKWDLFDPSVEPAGPLARLDEYRALGYPVMALSCTGPPGTGELQPLLTGKTSILVGQSGVGKSSIINRLLPDLDLQTGDLSRVTGKGTHTTTTTMLYHLPCGGHLVDSPGVWEYGLWELGQAELACGFVDFLPRLGECRFNDCRHLGEPDCAIRNAAESGEIRPWRYEAYRRLLEQESSY